MKETSPLIALLERATLQIRESSGKLLGSGFRIAEDLVLTAAHVVGPRDQDRLVVMGCDGTAIEAPWLVERLPHERPAGDRVWPPPDIAVLSLRDRAPGAWQIASVSDELPTGALVAVGFTEGLYDPVTLDVVPLEYEGIRTESGIALLKLAGSRVNKGMSGSAVLDLDSGLVVGFVKADRGEEGGGFVVSLRALRDAAPASWGQALASTARNATWDTARRLEIVPEVEVQQVVDYLEASVTSLSHRSHLLPRGVERESIRQPVRIRQVADGDLGAAGAVLAQSERVERNDPESFIWDPARSPWPMVGIVGAPGMGKSWMLAFHARSLAASGLTRLATSVAHDVPIPALVDAAGYARLLPSSPNTVDATAALAKAAHRALEGQITEKSCELLLAAAATGGRLVLCVDGLDEVPMELRPRLATALSLLGPKTRQLVVSTRDSARQTLMEVFPRGHAEFRIEGFTLGDARRFVQAWHRGNPAAVEVVGNDLRSFPHLRSLARVPLLLGFICRLATNAEGVAASSLPSTRSGLYREVALGLLSGRWRETSARRADNSSSDPHLRLSLIASALGQLAVGWRQRPDVFFRSDLQAVLRSSPGYDAVARSAEARWRSWQAAVEAPESAPPDDYVLWEYQYDGFLVPEVIDTRPALGFLHMVFAELCLAMHLAEQELPEVVALADVHRWFDDEWSDILPVACGVPSAATPLLEVLAHPEVDPWFTQCELETRCIAELPDPGRVDAGQLARLLARLSEGAQSPLHADSRAAVRSLGRLVDARLPSAVRACESLIGTSEADSSLDTESRLVLLLGLTAAGSPVGVRAAIDVIESQVAPAEHLLLLLSALAQSSSEEAVDFLTRRLGLSDAESRLPLAVAMAHGDQLATDRAIEIARSTSLPTALRSDVVVALVESGVGEEAALELVLDEAVGWVIKCRAMVALLRIGAQISEDDVERLVRDPNLPNKERIELVRALVLRGDLNLLPVAADLILQLDIDHLSRFELARSMASISDLGSEVVRTAATDLGRPSTSRLQAIRALVEHGDEVGIAEAARLVQSNDELLWLRSGLFEDLLEHAPSSLVDAPVDLLFEAFARDRSVRRIERSIARMIRCRDSSLSRDGQRRFHEALAAPFDPANPLDINILVLETARAGAAGVGLLLGLALESGRDLDTRVRAALAAAQSDPRLAESLGEFLEDASVPESIRSRLTVALGMLGCRAAFHRLLSLMPESEPAYVALGALLKSPNSTQEMVRQGRLEAERAQAFLLLQPAAEWVVDYREEVRQLPLGGDSAAETEIRELWAEEQLRSRTDGRILGLLLPRERSELRRVGGMRDGKETRDWLARWIPEYQQIVAEELEVLRAEIENDPGLLPQLGAAQSAMGAVAQIAQLLDEWISSAQRGDWQGWASVLLQNSQLIGSDIARQLIRMASEVGESWPLHAAHRYASFLASDEREEQAVHEVNRSNVFLDSIREYLDDDQAALALDASALSVLKEPESAAAWFYASIAAVRVGQLGGAMQLLQKSAGLASADQAKQGRRTLLQFQRAWGLEPELVHSLREVLGAVEGLPELEARDKSDSDPAAPQADDLPEGQHTGQESE